RFAEQELAGVLADGKGVNVAGSKLGTSGESPRGRLLIATWLADLANEKACPKLALWRLARNIFDPAVGQHDTDASAVALDLVLRALGLESRPDVYIDDASYKAFAAALELPAEKLRDAAKRVHEDVFGKPPPAIAVRTF